MLESPDEEPDAECMKAAADEAGGGMCEKRDLTVARPKSPIFTCRSSCKKMLFDFKSRWIIFFALFFGEES